MRRPGSEAEIKDFRLHDTRHTYCTLLAQAGWVVQHKQDMNLGAGPGVAVREFQTAAGPCDYLLFLDGTVRGARGGALLLEVSDPSASVRPVLEGVPASPAPELPFRDNLGRLASASGFPLRVVGRLDSAEAERPEYGFLSAAGRGRAAILKPGTMIVQQPEIPTPLLVRFPFPAWATRKGEVAEPAGRDPFAGFR